MEKGDCSGDGNCFYHALSAHLNLEHHDTGLRAVTEIQNNSDRYWQFIADDSAEANTESRDIEYFIDTHTQNAAYGDHVML